MDDGSGRTRTHRAHNADLARVARFRPHAVSFLCECGAPTCEERVHLTVSAYEDIVSQPGRYLIARGHEAIAAPGYSAAASVSQ